MERDLKSPASKDRKQAKEKKASARGGRPSLRGPRRRVSRDPQHATVRPRRDVRSPASGLPGAGEIDEGTPWPGCSGERRSTSRC